jgi:hypothetical protein
MTLLCYGHNDNQFGKQLQNLLSIFHDIQCLKFLFETPDIFNKETWNIFTIDRHRMKRLHRHSSIVSSKGKSKLIIIQTDKISQQPENCENGNDPDFV